MWVEHGDRIIVADSNFARKSIIDSNFAVRADALITNEKDLYLFILIGDCALVILFDQKKKALGLVHVSWQGTDINLVGKVIDKLGIRYGTDAKNLVVGIGPAARKDSFIKKDPTQVNDPKWKPFLERLEDNKYKVDFVGLCKKQLLNSGISKKNIFDCKVDTVKDKRFFSHYAFNNKLRKNQGRFACVVGVN
jgi:copper oxidase (laccase) domain-containing protein